jgi:hypothetical protein
MTHLALHVRHWGGTPQNRLLVDWLNPSACELRDEELLPRFWFTSFDAHGPT